MKRFVASFLAVWSACVCLAAQPPKGLLTAPLMAVEDIRATNLKLETADDGTRYISMRLHLEGASAVRVYFSGVELAAGQELFVSNASGTRVYGPYKFNGPTQSGEFWSESIAGSDVIVELQTGPDGFGDLPFTIEAIEAAELTDVSDPVVEQHRETVESLYNGIPVVHEVVDGMAIYEGDIVLGPADQLPRVQPGSRPKDRVRSSIGITGSSYRWPNATMPYVIASNLPTPSRVTGAIEHWNSVMLGTVRLIPRTNEAAYVTFVPAASSGTCSAYIGKLFNGSHPINVGSSCSKGNVIHEIGHAWGLWHEHTREDRDRYVIVNLQNVEAGKTHNFTQNISNGDDIGSYDYGSIMHYAKTSFSSNGLPTIITVPAGISIGQRSALSSGDIAGIKALYPSSTVAPPYEAPLVTTTVTANPAGALVAVDGVTYPSPATFNWPVNSVHTIASVDVSESSVRKTFVRWSDGGAQSHTITVPTSATTYKVDYAIAYLVKATPVPVGSTSLSPISADGFYAAGKTVSLSATPPTGYCFTGWTGLVPGTPVATKVIANQSYDVNANFQAGEITLAPTAIAAPVAGGSYTVGVTANTACLWGAVSSVTWMTITNVTGASGPGTVTFTMDANTTGVSRVGYIRVAGKLTRITQAAI